MGLRHAMAALALIAAAGGASAHTASQGALQVVHPWVEPAAAGADTAVHPTLTNTGDAVLEITGATSPAAEEVRLVQDGAPVDRLIIDPGQTIGPPEIALTLHGLKVELPKGKAVPVTLQVGGLNPLQVRMAIGRDTMNPDEVVRMSDRD